MSKDSAIKEKVVEFAGRIFAIWKYNVIEIKELWLRLY